MPGHKTGCFGNLFESCSIDLVIATDTFFGARPSIRFYLIECILETEILWLFCCSCHLTSSDFGVLLVAVVTSKRLRTSPANARALITASSSL